MIDKIRKKISNISKNKNNMGLAKNISGAFIFKGLGMFLSFFSLPIYMRFFDDQAVLGVWGTIISVANWIFMFDIGIGNGLRNCLTTELVRGDRKRIKSYISSAYLMITVIALILLCIGFVGMGYVDWNKQFNISEKIVAPNILLVTMRIVFIGIILQFVFKLVAYILHAMQRSSINNMIGFLVSLFQVLAVLLMPLGTVSENLIRIAIVNAIVANILYIFVTIYVFRDEQLKGCGASLKCVEKSTAKATINIGLLFLWTQILHLLLVLTDDFLITKLTSPVYQVYFSIYYRLFSLVSTVFLLALTPVWSAVTKAQAEGNHKWINKIYRYANMFVLVCVIGELLLIAVLQFGINLWLGSNAIKVNYTYAFIFAVYGSIVTFQAVQETFSYGFGKVKVMCICYSVGIILKFAIAYFGTRIYPDAWIIVVIANICVILPYCIIQPHFIKKEITKIKENQALIVKSI